MEEAFRYKLELWWVMRESNKNQNQIKWWSVPTQVLYVSTFHNTSSETWHPISDNSLLAKVCYVVDSVAYCNVILIIIWCFSMNDHVMYVYNHLICMATWTNFWQWLFTLRDSVLEFIPVIPLPSRTEPVDPFDSDLISPCPTPLWGCECAEWRCRV